MSDYSLNRVSAPGSQRLGRLIALDALRGIAAFIVVTGHLFLMWPEADRLQIPLWLRLSPLRLLINGHACVILFFVLSGYVLAIPFLKVRNESFYSYAVKRFARIYLPFVSAIGLAAVLYVLSNPFANGGGSQWFHDEWKGMPLSFAVILGHLAMTGRLADMWLNGVMWSLVIELRVSLIFPILMVFCRNWSRCLSIAVPVYVVTTSVILLQGWPMQTSDTWWQAILVTLRFVPFFMIGIVAAVYHEQLRVAILGMSYAWRVCLVLLGIGTFYMPPEIYGRFPLLESFISSENLTIGLKLVIDLCLGVASGVFVVFARNLGDRIRVFRLPAIQWLGKISYSLYLVHLPVMFFLFRLLLGKMPFVLICLFTIAVALLGAEVFNRFIEQPASRVGKYLAGVPVRLRFNL